MIKLGVLFLKRKRPGFDPEWGKKIASDVTEHLKGSRKYDAFFPSPEIVDEATLRIAIEECRASAVDVLVVLQPILSDGNLGVSLGGLWPGTPVLWATPTRQEGPEIASNSLVGTHIFASTMRQLRIGFELVYGMPRDRGFDERFDAAVLRANAAARVKRARVGLIGYHAPGFIDVASSAVNLRCEVGGQLYHCGLHELLDTMNAIEPAAVREDVDRVMAIGMPLQDVTVDDLGVASRYYLALKQIMRRERLDVLGVRCWPELPNVAGQWPYLAFARMLTEGIPVGTEGDTDGAITCMIGNLLGFGTGFLSDWLEHDEQTITAWHGGNSTIDFLEPVGSEHGPRIARHFNNNKPAVVEGWLQAGLPVTIFRLWQCDNRFHMAAFEGETITPRRHLKGTNGLVSIDGLNPVELFDDLCHAGMPHHVAIFRGHHRRQLQLFARAIGFNWIGY